MKGSGVLRDYVKRLSDDDLKFLNLRLSQRIGSDVGEAVEWLQRSPDVDRWLSSADSASNFFDMIDVVDFALQQETKKRLVTYEPKQKQEKATQ